MAASLEKGDIQLKRNGGEFFVRYFDNEFPCSPAFTSADFEVSRAGRQVRITWLFCPIR